MIDDRSPVIVLKFFIQYFYGINNLNILTWHFHKFLPNIKDHVVRENYKQYFIYYVYHLKPKCDTRMSPRGLHIKPTITFE